MKANELMIFDLVRRKKDNRTMIVVEVGYDENIGAITTDDRFYGDFEDYHETQVEPIPLTPGILEKNGFVKSKMYEVWKIICDEYELRVTPWRVAVIFLDEDGSDKGEFSAPRSKYVHELQHCLKLVGIDKEITI